MDSILANIMIIGPFMIISWLITIYRTVRKAEKYSNSILLMISIFFTLFFIAGCFGDYIGYAFLFEFLLIMGILFLVPAMLIWNGLSVIRKESFSLAHLLSLLLGVGIGAGEIALMMSVLGMAQVAVFTSLDKYTYFFGMSVFYFSALLLSFVLYTILIQNLFHFATYDYIIIHGCGLINGNRMSKLLSNRCDRAIETYHKCKDKPILIPSGGKGSDESISEAKAMANYLREHGIDESHILLEDQSTTTMENLINSKKLIEQRGKYKKVALISSNYHIYRCLLYARSIDLKCVGIGAKVAFYYWPTALIREFVALFKQKKFILFTILGYIGFMLLTSVMNYYM